MYAITSAATQVHVSSLFPNDDVCMQRATMLHLITYDTVLAVAKDATLMEVVLAWMRLRK